MNVLVNTSARLAVTPDGQYWAPSENLAYTYWTRFLDVFDQVAVVARTVRTKTPASGSKAVTGSGVRVIDLPDYCGIRQFAKQYFAVRNILRSNLAEADAVYLSLPCLIGDLVWRCLPRNRPFGVGVCGDPYDAFAPGSSTHPLRPVLRWWFSRRLRAICQQACACTYVTKHALQRRYPCRKGVFSTYYSSIHLAPEGIAGRPPDRIKRGGPFRIVTVGSFDTWYKGPDLLLEAFHRCCERGLDANLTFVGDGRHRLDAEALAERLGVGRGVRFLGQLPFSAAVRAELDAADLFVLPSRQEGLPKALVEAMARGLPCIGTTVGGIPELLADEDLVAPNDAASLSHRIIEVLDDPERRVKMSARNVVIAQEYGCDILRQRRIAFYEALRAQTAAWMNAQSISPVLSADQV
jgi:glycosyltransferase involved in cell wall biosynthesis